MKSFTTQLSLFETPSELTAEVEHISNEQPETYTGRYAMHKYWSKKPFNLVSHYIKKYSSLNDIILDPFCGSGVTVIESVRLGRRAIGLDINPIAVTCTRMGLTHINIKALKEAFEHLRVEVEQEINRLYQTDCPKCGSFQAIATHTIWQEELIDEIWTECRSCGTSKALKKPTDRDYMAALQPDRLAAWYPNNQLLENSRINAKSGMKVSDLFTPRALSNLSLLLEKIRQIKDEQIKSVMEFCFSAMLPQASSMVFVIRRRGKSNGTNGRSETKAEVGSWVIGYWVPKEHFEIHVWRCFENRFKKILKGKREVNLVIPNVAKELLSFEDLEKSQNGYLVRKGTATDLSFIQSNSIDYIFTDPPHGNRIPYLELSLLWNSWLNHDFDLEDEIIISESRVRQKDVRDYEQRLKLAFSEMCRVLKPEGHASVVFNSLDDNTWISLLNALLDAGFAIKEISPLEYSTHSVVQDTRKNALKTDFVITCQKQLATTIQQITFSCSEQDLLSAIENYLKSRTNGAKTYEILNHLLISNIPTGKIFKVSRIIENVKNIATFNNGYWQLKQS
ncbi:DNA methyltransferase [Chloroflexus sp.]|uniref:DNA methyltransferase n=1 Tax=Chloroflexus sp. TaxID=1904827 RepID=UPI00298F03AE|nr:DNA methyltransferase [Chloroflexus sp.]MDW8403591.1 DNA methyltransferase [Chloroflexus sp.]